MTADVDLYVREGSRFVRVDDVPPGRRVPPIPIPVSLGDEADESRPNFTRVPARRCRHGSFARWAARNCCADRSPR